VNEQANHKSRNHHGKIETGTFSNDIRETASRNDHLPFDWELKEKVVKLEPEVNSGASEESFDKDSFNIDDFKARMALKLIKYGEPHNSFIKNERSTFTGAS
tara:strand:+ start:210 stop:515 length:306 start_codon:yes stop_codon:yes gene_type:complete